MMFNHLKSILFGSLRNQLMVGMSLVIISVMSLFIWNTTIRQQDEENQSHAQQVSALAESAATSSAVSISSRDYSGLQEIALGIARYPDLQYIIMLDLNGQVLAHNDPGKIGLYLTDLPQHQERTSLHRTANLVDVITPVTLADRHIGWVRLGMDRSHFNAEIAKTQQDGLMLMLIGIAFSILIAFSAGRILTRRLAKIQQVADEVNAGNSAVRVVLSGDDEAARLARQFNSMLDSLAQRDAELRISEEKHRKLFESMSQGVVYQDAEGRIVTANHAAERILGLTLDQMTGKTSMDPGWHAIHEDGSAYPGETHPAMQSLRTGKAVRNAVMGVFNPSTGDYNWININAVPQFRTGEKSPHQVYTTFEDITERKLAERLLAESEASLKVLIEHSPIAMLVDVGVDADEHVVMMNQQFTTLFGYTIEDIPNVRQWWPLAYPDEKYREELKSEWIRRVEEAIQSHGDIKPMESTVTCKDGSSRNIRISLASIGSRNIVTFEDFSARKQAEDELRRYKDHLEEVVTERTAALADANRQLMQTQFAMDRAGIGIHWLDDDGRFIYVNEYAAHLLGYTQEQMRAMSVTDVDPNFAGKDFKVQTQPLREIGNATFETAQRHKNGEIIPLEVTFYYQPGKEGSGGRFISFVTDIRQRKQAELVLRRAMEAAETANQAKSTFLTSMSHELRTPLNAILGFSSLMRRDEQLRPEQRANLDIINRSGEHLLTLINDILELAKIEAGKTQLNITPFDLGVLVRDVTDMMELRARAKGLRLLIDQSSQFPRFINGDEARLRQILINLLGNAVKFTEQGGVTLRLGTKQNTIAHLVLEIEDTGPGLPAEAQQHLFQPFMQFGKQPGDNKGTGLGLSITRQFVQLMGGNISVESTVGKGSLFRVELPLSEVKEADLLPQHETEKAEVIGLASGQPVYRILIVEDQLENQLLLSQLMQRIGFEIKVAADGKQSVQQFQSWQPHLIFMDRRMPMMDGIEATKAIRALPGGKEVKIVAVTASAFMEQRDEMLVAGMDDFVRKPYRFNEIYDCLARQLGVQYRYTESLSALTASIALTAEMLSVLPQAVRDELKAALESLDSERIGTVLEQAKPYDETLHQTLCTLVENFDYPSILKVLKTNQTGELS